MRKRKIFLALLPIFLVVAPIQANGQVKIAESENGFSLENRHLRIDIDRAGGRISALIDKRSGDQLVALWKGAGEIGGLLDDRLYFTSAAYEATVEEADSAVSLHLTASHVGGLRIEKTVTLRATEPLLHLRYTLDNGTQEPTRLWVRNFPVPGGSPLDENHLYTLPLRDRLLQKPFASEYFESLREPWAALQDTLSGAGLLAVVPGLEKFYFWSGSRENPTFEWIYPEIPAGQRMEATLALVVVDQQKSDWSAIAQNLIPDLQPPTHSPLNGWVDQIERFAITPAERTRGFWLSTGRGDGRQRLPEVVEIDLPPNGRRGFYVAIEALVDIQNLQLNARIEGPLSSWVQLSRERAEENAILVEPLNESLEIPLETGENSRLWLDANARRVPPGSYADTLSLEIGAHRIRIPLAVRIWPVSLPDSRPFDVRGYATLADFTGGYQVDDASLQRLDSLLEAYAQIGGSVFDWTAVWGQILENVKIAGTDETLVQVSLRHPDRLNLDDLPPLDFSYFDPWLEIARKHGVIRVETYMEYPTSSRWQWACLTPAVGKDRVSPDTPESEQVVVWLYGELRRYFESHNFRGFFCKIADEISPEHVPEYIRTAAIARRAGWRPFTTVTGIVARTRKQLDAMAPHCDQWQVAILLKNDFHRIARGGDIVANDDEIWFYGGSSKPFGNPTKTPFAIPCWPPSRTSTDTAGGHSSGGRPAKKSSGTIPNPIQSTADPPSSVCATAGRTPVSTITSSVN